MTYGGLLWLYGVTAIAAWCNFPTWWWLTYQAARDHLPLRFGLVRFALAMINVGVLFGVWARSSLAAAHLDEHLPPVPLIIGISRGLSWILWNNHAAFVLTSSVVFLLIGEILMLMASSIALKVAGKRAMGLPVFFIASAVWTVLHFWTPL